MKPDPESYRLPNGDATSDGQEYVTAWRALARRVKRLLPGWSLYGFDPGLTLREVRSGSVLELPLAAAELLAEASDDHAWSFDQPPRDRPLLLLLERPADSSEHYGTEFKLALGWVDAAGVNAGHYGVIAAPSEVLSRDGWAVAGWRSLEDLVFQALGQRRAHRATEREAEDIHAGNRGLPDE